MVSKFTDIQIERWRSLRDEAAADNNWVTHHQELDARRLVVQREMVDFLQRYLAGAIDTEDFRATFDRKTRTDWDCFGLRGLSGAMFLNKLVKHVPDSQILSTEVRAVLSLPQGIEQGRRQMAAFLNFLDSVIGTGAVERNQLQPARVPFFVSAWWHLQNIEEWPAFYISARTALERETLYIPTQDPMEDYFAFREAFLSLASALNLKSWELEHLCIWQEREPVDSGIVIPPITAEQAAPEAAEQTASSHAQIQWLLAKIGKKLGCHIWIASNDHNREWHGERLGDLSQRILPYLGMIDPQVQRIIGLIDVLWLRGTSQIAAAFEVEHTTSIYSGLLRMSDLAALSPNLNFPLYIVAPESRLDQVRRELSRPTFQTLELHKRCGFFSNEALIREASNIMQWANEPSAIERLASRVSDTSELDS